MQNLTSFNFASTGGTPPDTCDCEGGGKCNPGHKCPPPKPGCPNICIKAYDDEDDCPPCIYDPADFHVEAVEFVGRTNIYVTDDMGVVHDYYYLWQTPGSVDWPLVLEKYSAVLGGGGTATVKVKFINEHASPPKCVSFKFTPEAHVRTEHANPVFTVPPGNGYASDGMGDPGVRTTGDSWWQVTSTGKHCKMVPMDGLYATFTMGMSVKGYTNAPEGEGTLVLKDAHNVTDIQVVLACPKK